MAVVPEPCHSTAAAIDEWFEHQSAEKWRPHLGASLLGHPCERYLWLSFRWAVREHFSGRMLRLFDRGKREEAVFVKLLRNIGVVIHSTDADADGKQVYVSVAPHVGGSLDGIIESGVPEAPKARHIAEFKTHNKKSFDELEKKGVFEAKRRHWCQMQVYMAGTGIDRALYVAVCKDDDRLYTERVEYNAAIAKHIIERGARIALADKAPPPVSTDASWYQCKICGYYDFCHGEHLTREVNCRTCALSTPRADGTWFCEYWQQALTTDNQRECSLPADGPCRCHVLHPDLVPWKYKGMTGEYRRSCIIYEIDGKDVINGCGEAAIKSVDLLAGRRVPDPDDCGVPF